MPARNAKTGKKAREAPVNGLMLKFLSAGVSACLVFGMAGAACAQQSASPTPQKPAQEKPDSTPSAAVPTPPEKPAEKHSTPEDRQRLVAIAHKLEAAPLEPALGPDRDWAVKWVVAAPDFHVKVCSSLLADLRRPRYKYRSELSSQLLISSAAFLIEHPEQSADVAAQNVGGMEGVLKAYSAIIKADPQATAKSLDDLLLKQKEGKLAEAVREKTSDCH